MKGASLAPGSPADLSGLFFMDSVCSSAVGVIQSAPNHKFYNMTPNSQNYLKDFRFWFIIASFIILWVMILKAYPIG
ncbi:MAG: hypothetical protein HRU41_19015 [Saprospiraceae bacterium]|nr:hypothetical protein [Saprospiraceae bacterium]